MENELVQRRDDVVSALVCLGSNVGDRLNHLHRALTLLTAHCAVLRTSQVYETEPWGPQVEGAFLNQVAMVQSAVSASNFHGMLMQIETTLGRQRGPKTMNRTIDLDLLYFGQEVVKLPQLEIPHPRLHLRRFVLVPLVEIAPEFKHPLLGLSQRALLARCPDTGAVNTLNDLAV